MAKTAEKGTLLIGPPKQEYLLVKTHGLSPLLCNRNCAILPGDPNYDTRPKKDKTPPDVKWRRSLHREGSVHPDSEIRTGEKFLFPSAGPKKAIGYASVRFNERQSRMQVNGAVIIPSEYLVIDYQEPPYRFSSPARPPAGTSMIRTHRGRFDSWSMWIPLIICSDFIDVSSVINLLNLAGLTVGIGAYRVEKGGMFGQFGLLDETQAGSIIKCSGLVDMRSRPEFPRYDAPLQEIA